MRRRQAVDLVVLALLLALGICSCDSSSSGNEVPEQDQVAVDAVDQSVEESAVQPDAATDLSIPTEDPYTGEAGAVASFDMKGTNFYDRPFPSDLRRSANGRLDLTGFPNPYDINLVSQYQDLAVKQLDGFSPNTTVYFRFDGPLDTSLLPGVGSTRDAKSVVQLINVTQGSTRYGERIPVELFYWDKEAPKEGYYLEPYLLMARPLGGFPMAHGEQYACVVLRTMHDKSGKNLAASPLVQDALVRNTGDLVKLLTPLRSWILETGDISPWDVAVATVFTTSKPTDALVKVADYLRDEAVLELTEPPKSVGVKYGLTLFEGTYLAPNFMHGDAPYDKGGDFKFDENGKPLVHHMEAIPFTIGIPLEAEPVAGGWPVVEMSHGTGGDRYSFVYDGSGYELAQKGMASISIDQPLHGDRYTGPNVNVELYSFNFANPSSGRTLFQQAALDNVALTKILGEMEFTDENGALHTFNTSKVGYFGHSQGGLTGALFVAVEDGIQAAVLSGAGGGLAYTILLRKEIDSGSTVDIKMMVETMLKLKFDDEFDLFHPMMTLVQMLVDATDPINYSPYYFQPRFREKPLPIFMTSGIDDPYTPAITAENLAIAGGIPPRSPMLHTHPGFALKGLNAVPLPAKNNVQVADSGSVTALLAQFDGFGHFPIFDDETAIQMYTHFLATSLFEGQPEVNLE